MRFNFCNSFFPENTTFASLLKRISLFLLKISSPKTLFSSTFISGYFSYNPLAVLSMSRIRTLLPQFLKKSATVLFPEDILPVIPIMIIVLFSF